MGKKYFSSRNTYIYPWFRLRRKRLSEEEEEKPEDTKKKKKKKKKDVSDSEHDSNGI